MYLPPLAEGQTRIGLSIPVPPPWAEEIRQARIGYGDAFAEMIPSHITIIEPTAMNIYDIPALIVQFDNACDQVPAFSINLAGTGTFRPVSPVVYLQMAAGATECTALNNAANRGLVATKPRFPFHPHVTLAQDVPPEALDQAQLDFANFTANFKVEALWLYRQGDDGVWRKNCKFDLRG